MSKKGHSAAGAGEEKVPAAGAADDLTILHETVSQLARSESEEAAMRCVLRAVLVSLGTTRGLVSLRTLADGGIRAVANAGFAEELLRNAEQVRAIAGPCIAAFETGRRVIVEDVTSDPIFAGSAESVRRSGFTSCHSVPLFATSGEVVGVLTVHYEGRHVPDSREIKLMDLYAQMAADFVARWRADEQLRIREGRFRLLASQAPVGIFLTDATGEAVFVNREWCALAGIAEEEARGRGWANAVHPEDRERVIQAWQQAVTEGSSFASEFRFLQPNGTVVWLHGRAVRVRDTSGKGAGYIGSVVNITERKRADDANRRLAAIVESSDDAIFGIDRAGAITSWNGGAERLYGYTPAEIIGRSVFVLIPKSRQDEEPAILERVGRGDRVEHYETVRQRKDGSLVDVSLTISPLRDPQGRVIGASKIARDITDRKRHEAELRREEKIYRAIGESIDYGIWICDAEGRNIYVSESFLKLVGMTQAEASDFGWVRVLPPEDVDATVTAWKKSVETGTFFEREHRFKGVDGKWHPILARGVPVRDETGKILCWAGINLDIAAFKRTEEMLRHREQQLRLVTDNAIVFLAHCDREYRLKFVNRPYAARFGRTPGELVGQALVEIVGEKVFALVKPKIDAALRGQRVEFEMELPYDQLGKRWMRVLHEPERDATGAVVGVVAVITDITARKQNEQEMELARDKALAASRAKDDFLAALSHELRTPLSPVLLIASEMAANAALPEDVRNSFIAIRKNVELEARLIDDLLDLTRITRGKLSLNLSVQDVHAILRDAIGTMRVELAQKRLTLNVELTARRTLVWGDSVRLQQVFWNVLKNAVKFTPEGGQLSVRTGPVDNGDNVVIDFTDSGIGMTAEELGRAFEAFSQGEHAHTSASHRFGGVGLGLAISRMLVELHRGTIKARSAGRDCGSTFTIELPVVGAVREPQPPAGAFEESPERAAETVVETPKAKIRILLVEDHEPTRQALAQLLKRRDFDVVVAGSVAEARQVANKEVGLLISDVGLPDGNGHELMAELRERYGIPGIALTGYGMDHDVVRSQAAGFHVHLTKPITVQALEKALATALAAE